MYVYAIASAPHSVKIGYSADPDRRLQQLQVGHERKLQLVYKEPVDNEQQALFLEQKIHNLNRHKKLRGEWFNLSHDEAILEIQFAVIRYIE